MKWRSWLAERLCARQPATHVMSWRKEAGGRVDRIQITSALSFFGFIFLKCRMNPISSRPGVTHFAPCFPHHSGHFQKLVRRHLDRRWLRLSRRSFAPSPPIRHRHVPRTRRTSMETKNSPIKIQKPIFATPSAATANPTDPTSAATTATIRNMAVKSSMKIITARFVPRMGDETPRVYGRFLNCQDRAACKLQTKGCRLHGQAITRSQNVAVRSLNPPQIPPAKTGTRQA